MTDYAADDSDLDGFKTAMKNCLGVDLSKAGQIVATIHKNLEPNGGYLAGIPWDDLSADLQNVFDLEIDEAKQFLEGLTLSKSNKMPLRDLVHRPYKLNRYLYRPIITWNVNGKDWVRFGKNSLKESILELCTNTIPWGKAPEEWMVNACFKDYVHRKEREHDKWLDDAVEERLKKENMQFDRNVKVLYQNSGTTKIDVSGLGEVDFIILSEDTKTVFIVDCKHLTGRYDINNQRNDYDKFVNGKKPYNETMQRKLEWFVKNKRLLCEHFQKKSSHPKLDLSDYRVEGIFIINTPTLYMYDSKYRIYTPDQINDVVSGVYCDPEYTVEDEKGNSFTLKYPYFTKP